MCLDHPPLQLLVEDADAARLDDDIASGRAVDDLPDVPLLFRPIDHYLRPLRIRDIAVLLAVERIGFVERHVVSALRKGTHDAAVVGARPVPVGRDKARTEHRDLHDSSS
jgi:hypothetical protein